MSAEPSAESSSSAHVSILDDGRVLISQGAEARVYTLEKFQNRKAILKQRFSKAYRHPTLDKKLTKARINQEAKSLAKCQKNDIPVPAVLKVDHANSAIYLEYIEGSTVKALLRSASLSADDQTSMTAAVGQAIAKIHDCDLVHGDLTTSNMLARNNVVNEIVMIDFGLSHQATTIEDKAVDLYVLERAFLSTHPASEAIFQSILDAYRHASRTGTAVVSRLDEVRQRGRKKSMIG